MKIVKSFLILSISTFVLNIHSVYANYIYKTLTQKVSFEGFQGATFSNIPPTEDMIEDSCHDQAKFISYHFPETLPVKDPLNLSSDQYSIYFEYKNPAFSTVSKCGAALTTVAIWQKDNQIHQCQVSVILGYGIGNEGYEYEKYYPNQCKIEGDCYSNDCSYDPDNSKKSYGGHPWYIHPKT